MSCFKTNSPDCGCEGYVTPPFSGCACSSIPSTVYMTVTNVDPSFLYLCAVFQDCTLVYGPVPPELSGLNLGTDYFLSVQILTDSVTGLQFRYCFACDRIFFWLSRVFLPTADFDGYIDGFTYSWAISYLGSTCSPFSLPAGTIYQGGNSNCIVTISGVNPYSSPFGMSLDQYKRGGGFRLGGTASPTDLFAINLSTRGGLKLGGSNQPEITYILAAHGGIRIGGSSQWIPVIRPTGAGGGVRIGGSNHWIPVIRATGAGGGIRIGGSSHWIPVIRSTGTGGGFRIGGSSKWIPVIRPTGTGGGFRIGGGSQPQITYVFAGSGGIRIGGLGTTNDGGSGAHKYFHYIGS